MSKLIIGENELIILIETAMDIYRYNRPIDYSTGDENQSMEETIEDIINKLKELLFMLNSGKKIEFTNKSELFSQLDDINSFYEKVKYDK